MASSSELEKLERRYAENPEGRFFAPLADAYRKAGQVDRALELVRAGLVKHPDYLSAHIVLGRCLLDKGKDPDALATFQTVLGLDGENIIALKSLAEISERSGRQDEARTWLQKLLVVDPMNAEAEADLQRLGGAPAAPEAAAVVAEAPAEVAPETSFADLAWELAEPAAAVAAEPVAARAAEPSVAEAGPPEAPAPRPQRPLSIAEAATVPMEAVPMILPRRPEATVEMPAKPAPAPAPPPPALAEAVPELGVISLDVEPAAPAAAGVGAAPTEPPGARPGPPALDIMPFDDSLDWGTGERSSRAIKAEDVEKFAHDEAVSSPAVEFASAIGAEPAAPEAPPAPATAAPSVPSLDFQLEAPPDQSLGGVPAPGELVPRVELPADLSGAYSIVDDAADDLIAEMPAVAEPPTPMPEPAAEAAPSAELEAVAPSATDLPLIMPEDVTPPEELARPSAKMVQAISPPPAAAVEAEGEGGAVRGPMVTETLGDLYLRQGFRTEAADVYRRLLTQRPSDGALAEKLRAAEGPPPDLSAAALGAESVGAWLRRLASARIAAVSTAVAREAPAPGPEAPSPLEAAFSEPAEAEGAPTRPASQAFSLDAIFGAPAAPAPDDAGKAEPSPAPQPGGSSFDEFFGHPPATGTVRPAGGDAGKGRATGSGERPSDEDLSAFSSWLKGLKK